MKQARVDVQAAVRSFKTAHKEGFLNSEIVALCNSLGVDKQVFDEKLGVVTAFFNGQEAVYYHHDVELGLLCALENRNQTSSEWD